MLVANANDEKFLQKRFHIAEIIYNQLIKHCKKQFNKLIHDPRYKDASGKDRTALIREYGLSQFDIIKYSKNLGQKYKNYLDSKTVQCIAKRVYTSVKSVLYKGGKHIHFKRYGTLDTIETDTNINKLQFLGDKIRFNNIYIKVRNKSLNNPYIKEALSNEIRYIRVTREMFNTGYRYYVQIILEGNPPNKDIERETGDVGIDIGTSTIAVSSKDYVFLEELAPLSEEYNKQITAIQRKMDKSRKLMNPQNFDEDGNIKKNTKKFKKKWNLSHTYRLDRNRLRALYRKKSAYIKQSHEMLANRILALGNRVFVEDMNFKALQKRAKNTKRSEKVSTIVDKNGNEKQVRKYKKKKRFGKSINNKAPAMAISIIDRKLHYRHSEIYKVNTRTFKASQYNHITNEYNPKGLTVRGQVILPNTWIQRDLYSAFLLMNSNDDLQTTNRDKCFNTFDNFLTLHNRCIERIKRTVKHRPKSFGF
jgi:hypothetical protein